MLTLMQKLQLPWPRPRPFYREAVPPPSLTATHQEIRQPVPWNFERWEILLLVPGKVLWQKCIGGIGAKIDQDLCQTTGHSPPLSKLSFLFPKDQEICFDLLLSRCWGGQNKNNTTVNPKGIFFLEKNLGTPKPKIHQDSKADKLNGTDPPLRLPNQS